MFYSQEVIDVVRLANPIEEVVGQYVTLKGSKALCPFHEENTPSFNVHSKRQIARCFSCMEHAVDVFGFIMKIEELSFPEAVKFLADRKGVELPNLTDEDRRMMEKQKRRQQILAAAIEFYHDKLIDAMKLLEDKEVV